MCGTRSCVAQCLGEFPGQWSATGFSTGIVKPEVPHSIRHPARCFASRAVSLCNTGETSEHMQMLGSLSAGTLPPFPV